MTLVTEAVIFAAQAHDGMMRRGSRMPYIVHPMEAAAIAASLTQDEEIIAAAVLHDVIEDCGETRESLAARFGERVATLVQAESQTPQPGRPDGWLMRKRETVDKLRQGNREMKLIALADKLSNMRAIHRDYIHLGEKVFERFHEHDKKKHAWYYRGCAKLIGQEFGDTDLWRELNALVEEVFGDVGEEDAPVCGKS